MKLLIVGGSSEHRSQGVASGQAAVFYDPNSTRVLGGGWIAATEPVASSS